MFYANHTSLNYTMIAKISSLSQDKSNNSPLRDKLILIVFGLSGLTALVYEIIWIRPLSWFCSANVHWKSK